MPTPHHRLFSCADTCRHALLLVTLLLIGQAATAADEIEISSAGAVISRSGEVRWAAEILPSFGDEAAIRIVGDGLTIDFGGRTLRGAPASAAQDTLDGIGVLVEGRNVTVRNLRLDGYRVGILARACDGLLLEDVAVDRNFAQRLRSTPSAEVGSDWLWPHRNDSDEWRRTYGAGICVEGTVGATLRRISVRRSQNGIILSRVTDSRIYDNDCSFLSGWGLAMWRSSGNLVSRNAFDFCVRGYSHGVYNRGQDSAGILLFEQCSRNRLIENSATHGGDGIFGFAGREALGEAPRPDAATGDAQADTPEAWHRRRGCNDNLFVRNDLSYAVAHGLELTFSFGNVIAQNRLVGNAICGIWGGYSQETTITANRFAENGDRGYGMERGGVNIEHGVANRIVRNIFERNRCGIHLWWDADEAIMRLPWAQFNDTQSRDNLIVGNSFDGDEVAIHLTANGRVAISGNTKRNVGTPLRADAVSTAAVDRPAALDPAVPPWDSADAIGATSPIGARRHLRGRERIVMTEWGPYDWSGPLLRLAERSADGDVWLLLGDTPAESAFVHGDDSLRVETNAAPSEFHVRTDGENAVLPYRLSLKLADGTLLEQEGLLVAARWDVRFFTWDADPRSDHEGWCRASDSGVRVTLPSLTFPYGNGGPGALAEAMLAGAVDNHGNALDEPARARLQAALAAVPDDGFGTLAETTVRFPPGRWRISTTSDDGVRVLVNGEALIENWTWHAPTVDRAELEFSEATDVAIRVEHFELDGYATLDLTIERAETLPIP